MTTQPDENTEKKNTIKTTIFHTQDKNWKWFPKVVFKGKKNREQKPRLGSFEHRNNAQIKETYSKAS